MNKPPLFKQLSPNSSIENYNPRKDLHKGTFSDEARSALAKAVKNKKVTVHMDGHTMQITYRMNYLFIVAQNRAKLPSGNFYTKELLEKWGE